jgi:hypothetical protein
MNENEEADYCYLSKIQILKIRTTMVCENHLDLLSLLKYATS